MKVKYPQEADDFHGFFIVDTRRPWRFLRSLPGTVSSKPLWSFLFQVNRIFTTAERRREMVVRTKPMLSIVIATLAAILILNFAAIRPAIAHSEEEEDGHLVSHEIGKLNITGGITSILQGTSGIADNSDVTDFTYTLDLNFEAAISPAGKVVIALEAGNGTGVNDINGTEHFLSVPNYDAFITEIAGIAAIAVSQVYFEGSFLDGRLGLHAGKLDVHSLYDENIYANDETDQFISGIFTRYPGSIFPELDSYYAPGVALTFMPSEMVEIRLIGANGMNISSGEPEENTGFGFSLDQEVADDIGLFARYAMQDEDHEENLVKSAISGGVSLSGSLWDRKNDVVGIAYGILSVNDKAPDIAAISNSGDEGHFEIYYKLGFSDHFTLTPDLQVITNTGGDADNDTTTVYGVRAQMNF